MKSVALPSSLRKMNRRLILRHLVQVPAAARGELAEVAGTSAVTAGKIVDELLEQGVLEGVETKREGSRPGRPGQNLRLNTTKPRFILVQLGVGNTRVAFVPLGVKDDAPWGREFATPGTVKDWAAAVREAVEATRPAARADGIWGVLLSVPGIVNEEAGRVLFSPNVHWSEGVNFRELLGGIASAPVELVQEIRALALGQLAASPREADFLLVDFGHGVGGAAVLHGGLYHGSLPLAGELGHNPVLDNDRVCGCGSVGCVETLVSRDGLFRSVQEKSRGKRPGAAERYNWSLVEHHVAEHGLEPWLERSLKAAAASIASAMNVLGLGRVVITGSLTVLPERVREYMAGEIKKAVLWEKFGRVLIDYAPRRRMRGMISVGIERLVVGGTSP